MNRIAGGVDRVELTIVTHQGWRAEDVAPHATPRVDFGLDLDAALDSDRRTLWCPGAWAAAAVLANPELRFASAGPHWMQNLPIELTGRTTTITSSGSLAARTPAAAMFVKLPEAKTDLFPAEVRTAARLKRDLAALPPGEPVAIQPPMTVLDEVRCWILDGEVVATASYFPALPREAWSAARSRKRERSAGDWLRRVLKRHSELFPPAVVIDVGQLGDGSKSWRIIEANAAWSADWYDPSDMPAVIATIVRSQRDVPARWCWAPSPLLVRSAAGLLARYAYRRPGGPVYPKGS